MKILITFFLTLFSVQSFANNCEIAYPGQVDEQGTGCSRSYGVMYNGYLISGCYEDMEDAYELMKKQIHCKLPDAVIPVKERPYKYCRIYYPEDEVRFHGDRNIYCSGNFGVICTTSPYYAPFKTYSSPKCIGSFEDAMKKLYSYRKSKSKK